MSGMTVMVVLWQKKPRNTAVRETTRAGQSPVLGAGGARYQCETVTGILLIVTCSQVCLFVLPHSYPDGLSTNTQTHTPMHTHFLCI